MPDMNMMSFIRSLGRCNEFTNMPTATPMTVSIALFVMYMLGFTSVTWFMAMLRKTTAEKYALSCIFRTTAVYSTAPTQAPRSIKCRNSSPVGLKPLKSSRYITSDPHIVPTMVPIILFFPMVSIFSV